MHRRLIGLFVLVLFCITAAAQQTPSSAHTSARTESKDGLPSEATVNAFLQQTFGYEPGLTWKIVGIKPSEAQGLAEVNVVLSTPQGQQSNKFYVTPDGKHAVIGDILPFGAHPYDAAKKELDNGVNGPTIGPPNAPVTVIEFSDLQCPHCKEFHPTLDKLMAEHKDVRVVFQLFPLPMHDWAAKAANYAECVSESSHQGFWRFVDDVFAQQSDITAATADEKLTAIADKAGVKGSDIAACAAKPATTTRIEKSVELAKELDVNSTPTLFVNGRKIPGVPYDVLEKIVNFAAKEAK